VAQQKGVISTDIPLDDTTDNIVSESLYEFCELRFLYHLFIGVTGAYELEDVYKYKAEKADVKSEAEAVELSYYIITEKEVTQPQKRGGGIPIR